MKKYGINARSFLTLLRKCIPSFGYTIRKNRHKKEVLNPEEKLLLLCMGLLGKGEMKVRKEARELPEPTIKKCWVDVFPRYHFKELSIESERFALWVGFAPKNGLKRKEGDYLSCDSVFLYFTGEEQREKFLRVLDDEQTYCKLWDGSYTDIQENKFRIGVGGLPHYMPEKLCYLWFREWKDTRKKKYQRTVETTHKTT